MTEQERLWYIPDGHQQPTGPFTTDDILERCQNGTLSGATLCWREGMSAWQPLATVEPFRDSLPEAAGGDVDSETVEGLDELGRAFSRAMNATRRKAKTASLRVSVARHQRRRGQLFAQLGEMVYAHKDEIEVLSQEGFAEKVSQIETEEECIASLRRDMAQIENAG